VSANLDGEPPARALVSRLPRSRQRAGFAVAVLGPVLLTVVLLPARDALGLDTVLLLFVLVSVIASALGGVLPALAASAIGLAFANFAFSRLKRNCEQERSNSNKRLNKMEHFVWCSGTT